MYLPAGLLLVKHLALGEYFNVFGYGLPAAVEVFGKGIWGHGVQGQQRQDGPARGVGNSLEYVSSCHNLQPFSCKYKCNRSVAQIYLKKILHLHGVLTHPGFVSLVDPLCGKRRHALHVRSLHAVLTHPDFVSLVDPLSGKPERG